VLVAGLCIAAVESLGHRVYGAAQDLVLDDADAMATYVAGLPIGALLLVLAAWLLGAVLGGCVAAWITARRPRLYGGLIAALVLLGALLNFSTVPHPPWFMALSVVSLGLAGIGTGTLMARRAERSARPG
jgi:MFS family permease